jgi:DNA polymerase
MTESTAADKEAYSKPSGSMSGSVLDEETRRYYLEAMGVQCWQSLQPVRDATAGAVNEHAAVTTAVSGEAAADDSKHQAQGRATNQSIDQTAGRPREWPDLEASIQHCSSCQLHATRKQALVGRGNPSAELMFVLLAPESVDEEAGLICSGEAGALFTKMLAAIDIDIKDVYITSLIKCLPPRNHTISPREIMCCNEHLKQQVDLVKPSHIIVLGETAIQCLLQKPQPIDRVRVDINSASADTSSMNPLGSIPLFVSYSPHELLQKAELKRGAWADLQQLQKLIQY